MSAINTNALAHSELLEEEFINYFFGTESASSRTFLYPSILILF